ncbi:MAG TPA: 50S ribosomal protein L11 methyltransferase, partial [Cytophagaceae bacterium]
YKEEHISYSVGELENKNWNEEWEKNFDPVMVEDKVAIRASFHPASGLPLEIIINPKMSFGTGHHETTYMMVQNQLEIDHKDKLVMDAGSGTGVLAILACKLGAKQILAFDVEDWAFENLQENVKLNNCSVVIPAKGDITQVNHLAENYDIILANINKNVLLKEMPLYARYLKQGGTLILSGFYEEDIEDIQNSAFTHSLDFVARKLRNRWASLVFQKA